MWTAGVVVGQVWLELGTLYEGKDTMQALKMYSRAREALKRRKAKVPAELLNNIAALYHKSGILAQAEVFYLKALKQLGVAAPTEEGELVGMGTPEMEAALRGSAVSVLYNLARLREEMKEVGFAERLYRSMLKERPNYTDCQMRLGAMAEARGNNHEASLWYRHALALSPNCADAYTALAKLLAAQGDLAGAQKKLEKLLWRNERDEYAGIMLGNIYLNNAKFERNKDKEKEHNSLEKFKMLLSRALDRYTHVLHKRHSNVFAANGAAAVLLQTGRIKEAKQIFSQVTEAGDSGEAARQDARCLSLRLALPPASICLFPLHPRQTHSQPLNPQPSTQSWACRFGRRQRTGYPTCG